MHACDDHVRGCSAVDESALRARRCVSLLASDTLKKLTKLLSLDDGLWATR
jgi:hypothetical protein